MSLQKPVNADYACGHICSAGTSRAPESLDFGTQEAAFPSSVFADRARLRAPHLGAGAPRPCLRGWGGIARCRIEGTVKMLYAAAGAAGPPRITALPPAFSIFSTADLENLCAWMVMAAVSSPEPRILIGAFLLEAKPSFT